MSKKHVVIIGAGPAGLTAAYELLGHGKDLDVLVVERERILGGLSRTQSFKGNQIDIGGHRFFSKSGTIMDWWLSILPLQGKPAIDDRLLGRAVEVSTAPGAPDPETEDRVMLFRRRLSRIFFGGAFFDYPITLSGKTLRQLGVGRILRVGLTYVRARLFPLRPEKSLEDFFINRFGRELYETFFRNYTEKVWGVPCRAIDPEWGAQRVKGLSIHKVLLHALRSLLQKDRSLEQRGTETSLIGQFLYPKFGPGQLWETVGQGVRERGGDIALQSRVSRLFFEGNTVVGVEIVSLETGEARRVAADYVLSSAPVRDLVAMCEPPLPAPAREVAEGLVYRDFMTVGMLVSRLRIRHDDPRTAGLGGINPDNWVYIQEPSVRLGRLQIFNNWSPYMVADRNTVWLGLEYFCNEGDDLWSMQDASVIALARDELARIGIIDKDDMLDAVVLRVPKAYPAYFGTYDRLDEIRACLDPVANLFLVGRNGMHRYNNMDHSMLSAMEAVRNILEGRTDKDNIWNVNAEQAYHE